MARSLVRIAPLVAGVVLWVGGCDAALGPDSVGSVLIRAERSTLRRGESVVLELQVLDPTGQPIPSREAEWLSRDPSTAEVHGPMVTGMAPGVTQVVADVRGRRDSVRIRVRFDDLDTGEVGVRIPGEPGFGRLDGRTLVREQIGREIHEFVDAAERTEILTLVGGQYAEPVDQPFDVMSFPGDHAVWIAFDGKPRVGRRLIRVFPPAVYDGVFGYRGTEQGIVVSKDPSEPGRVRAFFALDGVDLEIEEVELPAEPGLSGGIMRGNVSFEAAGLVLERDPETFQTMVVGQVGDTTIHVYAEFETSIFSWLWGAASLTVDGGPFDNETDYGMVTGRMIAGRPNFTVAVTYRDPPPIPGDLTYLLTTLSFMQVDDPRTGTIPIGTVAPADFDEPGEWPTTTFQRLWIGHFLDRDGRIQATLGVGHSTGGAFSITEYRPATRDEFGIIRGSFAVTADLYDDDGRATGETVTSESTFAVPIEPTCTLTIPCPE